MQVLLTFAVGHRRAEYLSEQMSLNHLRCALAAAHYMLYLHYACHQTTRQGGSLTVLRVEGSRNLEYQTRVCMGVAEPPTPQGAGCEPHQGLQSVLPPCCCNALLQTDGGHGLRSWHAALVDKKGILKTHMDAVLLQLAGDPVKHTMCCTSKPAQHQATAGCILYA